MGREYDLVHYKRKWWKNLILQSHNFQANKIIVQVHNQMLFLSSQRTSMLVQVDNKRGCSMLKCEYLYNPLQVEAQQERVQHQQFVKGHFLVDGLETTIWLENENCCRTLIILIFSLLRKARHATSPLGLFNACQLLQHQWCIFALVF